VFQLQLFVFVFQDLLARKLAEDTTLSGIDFITYSYYSETMYVKILSYQYNAGPCMPAWRTRRLESLLMQY
jgi:hypothetical protein